ncbi:ATP-binding protein [Streptomyces fructofermentans]|uniref:ATP-binding protein n=1 Tax=Streptomyces fructofermentans TaxID=152141 RepID=A0A918K0Q5_9ACTN|nr:ATP-binding protein [Streptomyces fructofermentans]GGX40269.1 ATP-binding protein [Streptomyces fructofermentans]
MSLPLTRRIARAALLIAAGAAPVVGAAGSASAAELPAAPDLGGLTSLDTAGSSLDGATRHATGLAGNPGGKAVKKAVPATGKTGGKAVKKATPAAQKAAGDVAGTASGVLGDAAESAGGGLPTDAVGKGALPAESLPLKGLPLG